MDLVVTEHIVRVLIVRPESRIDAFNAAQLRARLDQLLNDGVQHFVIDLSVVPFLDSAGMAVLVNTLKRARQSGGDVKLVWPREEAARRILRLTKFDRVFQMAESVADALRDD